jgi:hypothetical protein
MVLLRYFVDYPTAIRRLFRWLSDGYPMAIRWLSDGYLTPDQETTFLKQLDLDGFLNNLGI